MANSSDSRYQDVSHASSPFNGVSPTNAHGDLGYEGSSTTSELSRGVLTEWSVEEQRILEDGLNEFKAEQSIICYAKIAMRLPYKTIRDVALRCRWMSKKERNKRRKEDISARKSKEIKGRDIGLCLQSHMKASPIGFPNSTPVVPRNHENGIPNNVIDGVTRELLEQNAKALDRISTNLSTMKVQENVSLFCQTRDNILRMMNELNELPYGIKKMPPLPVNINEELLTRVLPHPNLPMEWP